MDAKIIVRILPHITRGKVGLDKLEACSGIDRDRVLELLPFLIDNGIGEIYGNILCFSSDDRLRCAMLALRLGSTVNEVVKYLDWRDFEAMASIILSRHDYLIHENLRMQKPRIEIDIVALKMNMSLAIDCKHWKRSSGLAKLTEIVVRQVKRAKHFMESEYSRLLGVTQVIPVILTFIHEDVRLVNGVPVVPIEKFSHFLLDLDSHLDSVKIISLL